MSLKLSGDFLDIQFQIFPKWKLWNSGKMHVENVLPNKEIFFLPSFRIPFQILVLSRGSQNI